MSKELDKKFDEIPSFTFDEGATLTLVDILTEPQLKAIKSFINEHYIPKEEVVSEVVTQLRTLYTKEQVLEMIGEDIKEHPCLKDKDYPHDECISGQRLMKGYNLRGKEILDRLNNK